MNIGILGTGMVGNSIATKLVQNGHQVKMGSRTADNEKAIEWSKTNGDNASNGTFAGAAKFGEVIFNCTAGAVSMEALKLAGKENLRDKILVDLANPLNMSAADWEKGIPPTLLDQYSNTTSLGEEIQKAFPETKVVKTLNTMNHLLMVDKNILEGDHDLFISGNDQEAKNAISELLKKEFSWESIIDLGGIETARGTEMLLPLWLSLWKKFQKPEFNFKIVTGN